MAFPGFHPGRLHRAGGERAPAVAAYDNSKRLDLTTVFPQLDLPGSRVYKGDLYPTISDLEAKFGARG